MKCLTTLLTITVCLMSCTYLQAEGVQLKRAQWLKKVGSSVMDQAVLKETFGQVKDLDKVEFVQRSMKAVSRMPVEPEKKAASFVSTAVICIQTAKGDIRYSVIAEVFATVNVPFLPLVTEELSKRFDQEFNKLSDEAYEKIASSVIEIAIKRNGNDPADDPAVRNTFVVLAFLRGSNNTELETKLLALMPPDGRTKRLVEGWLPDALKGDYEALLAAADVEPLKISPAEYQRLVGHSNLSTLLFRMRSEESLAVAFSDSYKTAPAGLKKTTNFGVNSIPRFPTGYQNQSTSVKCCPPPTHNPWIGSF